MRKYFYLPGIVLFSITANAQFNLGIATSGYNTINSMYLNPANVAGCKEKIVFNLFFLNLSADNNLGTISKLSNIFSNNANTTFTKSGGRNFSMIVPYGEVRGPGILICSNGDYKSGFAITTRIRIMNQLNNFDESIYNTITNPNSASNRTIRDTSRNFNWTAQLWSEVGFTYGIVLVDKNNSQLKAGVTLRYLGSLGYVALKGNYANVLYNSGSDSFHATNSDMEYASNILQPANAISNGINTSSLFTGFLGTTAANGLGTDIGATYSYRIYNGENNLGDEYDEEQMIHKLRFSAAITDIGAIKYKDGYNSTVNVTGNGYLTGNGLAENANNYNQFKKYIVAQGFTTDTGTKATKVHLPTALLLSADYEIYQRFYANATFVGNLVNRQQFGNSYYNQFTITPRYDSRLISIGIPVTYSALAHDYKVGFGFRIAGFYIGSDDMLALISNNQHGFGVYFGASVPIYKKQS